MLLYLHRVGRVGVGSAEVMERALHELLDLVEPAANMGVELARRADEVEEAGRVHLGRGDVSQLGELLGVPLQPCDHEAPSVFGPVRRRLDDGIDECPDELPRRLVARHELRRTPNRDRKHPRWLLLVGASCSYHEIIDRMIRRLLECDAHDAPAVAEFTGAIAEEQTGEIANRHLPLEGHAAAARRVGAHARRYRPGAATAVASLRADRSFRSARRTHPDTRVHPRNR